MIEVQDLSVTFPSPSGEVEALCNVSLSVPDGEIVAICGPSGAGKTTFLRCLSMLQSPTAGRILVDGEDVSSGSAGSLDGARRKIGMVFQGFNLLRSRTALGNVMLPLEIRRVSRQEASEKADEYLALVHMSHRRDFYPEDLSGGEKQRVSIARALVTEPRVLILDEPTSALDPDTAASIVQSLKDINRARNITILVVTHQIDVLAPICDRITYLRDGRLSEASEVPSIGPSLKPASAPSAPSTVSAPSALSGPRTAIGGDA